MRNLDRLLSILEERHQEPQRVKHLTLILHLVQVRTGYTCRSWQVYLTCSETAPVMESRVNNCPFWLEKNPFLNKNSLLQFKLIIFVISDNNVVIWLAPMYFMVAFQLSLSSSSSSTDSALSVNPQKTIFPVFLVFFVTLLWILSPFTLSTSFIRQSVQNRLNNGQEEQNYFTKHDVCLFHNSMMFLTMSSLWSNIIPDSFF